ncbi:cytochrome c [Pleurocapsales cyanobacterium LEGE 06147]|nr:cytochrome c [Pleurocapsales cyanobacterium LEGE 06147]
MNNQLVQANIWAQRLILAVALLVLLVGIGSLGNYWHQISDPYVREVLSLRGDTSKGHAIFQINCVACHGLQAYDNVGPSLQNVSKRKSKVEIIYQVVSGKTPPMPKFQPNPQEMADLLSYLEQL